MEKSLSVFRSLFLSVAILLTSSLTVSSQTPSKAALPKSLADLQPYKRDDRILKAVPTVEIKVNGGVNLTFETMTPTPPPRAFFGQINPDLKLEAPFFQFEVRESGKKPAISHRLSFDLKKLENAGERSEDSPAHEGDVYFRLEIFDSRSGRMRYFESRFHYFGQAGRYEKRTTILYGPFVDQVTDHSAVIFWTTDRPSRGVVQLFLDASPAPPRKISGEPVLERDHKIKITGLNPGSVYGYQVLAFDGIDAKSETASRIYSLRSAPEKSQQFHFVFMSDGRPSPGGAFNDFGGVNARVTQPLLNDSYRRGAEFILFGGDLTAGYTSSAENFDLMLNAWKLISEPVGHLIPIYEGMGNHESLGDFFHDAAKNSYNRDKTGNVNAETEFARHFANPEDDYPSPEVRDGVTGPSYRGTVYSFDYGNSHFVMLNTDYWFTHASPLPDRALPWKLLGGNRNGYIMENQMNWLAKDLADARKRGVEHIFVCGQDMAFPTSSHSADAMWWNGLNDSSIPLGDVVAMRDRFMKLINDYGVTAMLFGHEHTYSRTIIDHSIDPLMQHPVTQIISGGAGAPFYPRDIKVPWNSAVKKYARIHHYVLFTVDGANVTLSAIDLDGNVFDTATLP
ncbi:MAG: metallophosphoesterase [Acidobacteriia bacterium]|nr:metallophosphoesterase [Terriglobia bacterium]